MKPAIRLSALMNLPTLFIFSHNSPLVGEDGPTHQPIESNHPSVLGRHEFGGSRYHLVFPGDEPYRN